MIHTAITVMIAALLLSAFVFLGYLYGVSRSCKSIREGLRSASHLMSMAQYEHDNSPVLMEAAADLLEGYRIDQPQQMRRLLLDFISKEQELLELGYKIETT